MNKYFTNYFDVPPAAYMVFPIMFIESLAMSISFFIAIYLKVNLHYSTMTVGELVSAMSLGTFLGSILSGYLTTKIPPMRVASMGSFLFGSGFLSLYFVDNKTLLFPTMFICGVGGVLMMVANLSMVVRSADQNFMKNRVIVLQSVIFNFTVSLSGFFLSYASDKSIRELFLFVGFSLFACGVFCFIKKYNIGYKATDTVCAIKSKVNLFKILVTVSMVTLYSLIFSVVKVYFAVDIIHRFESPFAVWIALSANPLIVVFFQPFLIGWLRGYNNINLLFIGGFLVGAGYFLFGFMNSLLVSLVCVFIATLGEMIFSPISKNLASTSLGAGMEGIGISIWKCTYYVSGVFGAVLVGYLGDVYSEKAAWSVCFLLPAIIMLYMLIMNFFKANSDSLLST